MLASLVGFPAFRLRLKRGYPVAMVALSNSYKGVVSGVVRAERCLALYLLANPTRGGESQSCALITNAD